MGVIYRPALSPDELVACRLHLNAKYRILNLDHSRGVAVGQEILMLANRASTSGEAAGPQKIETVLPSLEASTPPQQPSVELERLYRKQRLAAAYRLFARLGYDSGGAGHITARDPEFPDRFWVNPHCVHFSRISVSELMLVDHNGRLLQPPARSRPLLNRAAFAIHSEIHRARPEVVAAAHSHSTYGKAFSTLGHLLDPITQDACMFHDDHVLFESYTGVVLDSNEGREIARALGHRHAAILQHHGLLAVGQSVEAAVWRYVAMEEACRVQLLAMQAGTPRQIAPGIAATATRMGSEAGGIFAFQPYWEMLTAEEPDLLS
jgi:ribulose-5-phosphate 4-epimerase/fuculose-1-phosphate aldolase